MTPAYFQTYNTLLRIDKKQFYVYSNYYQVFEEVWVELVEYPGIAGDTQ